jgi:choline-sulfatase
VLIYQDRSGVRKASRRSPDGVTAARYIGRLMEGRRPNVLLVMADQLAASWLPAHGHAVVRAPRLSALAEESTVFDAAYCASPLCAPSRAALLTGRLPSRTGVYDNAAELPASAATVTHALRASGYFTALVGKMHFVGPDQLHGFEERLTTDIYPGDLDWTPDWRLPAGEQLPWYHTMESVLEPGVCAASMQQDYDDEVAFRAVRTIFDLARSDRERPFFLVVSFTNPHDPWELRARYWDLYDRDEIELPAVPLIPLEDADPHSRRLRAMCGVDDTLLTEEQVRTARHGYYAAISYLDERVGEVLDALEDAGFGDDTVVAFTADHGEMLGERGLWYKMAFFEQSARVPLFLRAPDGGGGRVTEPVSLLDVGPTLLEVAGVPGLEDVDGQSLVPFLAGDVSSEARRRGPVVAEYLAEGVNAPAVMVRRGSHKLVHCPGDPDQLYDLAADPAELANLARGGEGDAAGGALRELREEVDRRWDLEELELRVLASQRERHLLLRALGEGAFRSWGYQPAPGNRYVGGGADLYGLQRRARLDAVARDPRPPDAADPPA